MRLFGGSITKSSTRERKKPKTPHFRVHGIAFSAHTRFPYNIASSHREIRALDSSKRASRQDALGSVLNIEGLSHLRNRKMYTSALFRYFLCVHSIRLLATVIRGEPPHNKTDQVNAKRG